MEFNVAMHTDVGILKKTNQDSLCVKKARTKNGNLMLAVICDGMGGLEKGELASSTVINAFNNWFNKELPKLISQPNRIEEIQYSWDRLIKEQNQIIGSYGRNSHIQLGTTLTIMLILENGEYIIGHVGDSRAYRITDNDICVLTEDQTVVANEIKMGRLTPEQAKTDPRRSVLLQCIGASKVVEPAFYHGSCNVNECYMLCSDGFRHVVEPEEINNAFAPSRNNNTQEMKANIVKMIELNKDREETDNISSILVKIV